MRPTNVSWCNFDGTHTGGNKDQPTWSDIDYHLQSVKANPGAVTLSTPGDLKSLQVFSDGEYYLLLLGELTEEDWEVRSYNSEYPEPDRDVHAEPSQIEILGDRWNTGMCCKDFRIVEMVFRELFNTGDVSRDVMS
jgi:hypothetical protein